jgi:hypothetical protein
MLIPAFFRWQPGNLILEVILALFGGSSEV